MSNPYCDAVLGEDTQTPNLDVILFVRHIAFPFFWPTPQLPTRHFATAIKKYNE